MLIIEKRCGKVKGRCVFNGKGTREYFTKEETTSPTTSMEGLFMTSVIDAKERRDILTGDIPNAFIQSDVPTGEGEKKIIMKITGRLIDVLLRLAPDTYSGYVVYENGKRVLYVQVLRALYGMLMSAMLWYNKFRGDLEEIGFVLRASDPGLTNVTSALQ